MNREFDQCRYGLASKTWEWPGDEARYGLYVEKARNFKTTKISSKQEQAIPRNFAPAKISHCTAMGNLLGIIGTSYKSDVN
jgi:hypothetical protein